MRLLILSIIFLSFFTCSYSIFAETWEPANTQIPGWSIEDCPSCREFDDYKNQGWCGTGPNCWSCPTCGTTHWRHIPPQIWIPDPPIYEPPVWRIE